MSKITHEQLALLLEIHAEREDISWDTCSRNVANTLARGGLITNDDGSQENDDDRWYLSKPALVHINAIINVELPVQQWISPLEQG